MPEEKPNIFKFLVLKVKSFIFTNNTKKRTVVLGIFFVLFFGFLYVVTYNPPKNFPLGQVLTIETGQSLQSITSDLVQKHIIKFAFTFRSAVIAQGGEKRVIAGDYLLDKKESPIDLARRVVNGQFHLPVVKITIPEGWNVFEIADYLSKNLMNFNKNRFLSLAKKQEGYLFPETYFVSPTVKPEVLIDRMKGTFDQKIASISGFSTSTYKLSEIITLASIVEDEARTTENRKIVAGILLKRLSLGMPLQVDSTFMYINGKNTYNLTASDLKIDSPYNTYVYKGLPPGPINNPGLDAISAILSPTKTPYLYFLSSKSGVMYYAKTFAEHVKNKELYLNN